MCRLASIGLVIALAACQVQPSTPDQVYLAFYNAVAQGDWDRALTFLTPETKVAFTRMGRELAQALPYEGDPLGLFLQSVRAQVTPQARAETIEQDDARARVAVTAGRCGPEAAEAECSKSEVVLERRDGRWLIVVDLPAAWSESAEGGG